MSTERERSEGAKVDKKAEVARSNFRLMRPAKYGIVFLMIAFHIPLLSSEDLASRDLELVKSGRVMQLNTLEYDNPERINVVIKFPQSWKISVLPEPGFLANISIGKPQNAVLYGCLVGATHISPISAVLIPREKIIDQTMIRDARFLARKYEVLEARRRNYGRNPGYFIKCAGLVTNSKGEIFRSTFFRHYIFLGNKILLLINSYTYRTGVVDEATADFEIGAFGQLADFIADGVVEIK